MRRDINYLNYENIKLIERQQRASDWGGKCAKKTKISLARYMLQLLFGAFDFAHILVTCLQFSTALSNPLSYSTTVMIFSQKRMFLNI